MSSEISRWRSTQRSPHPSSSSPRCRNRPIKLRNQSNLLILDATVHAGDNHRSLLSPRSPLAYPEDSRVLISVSMEGSPGPIRTLMKLSSSVEEAIKFTIDEYAKEGRIPQLEITLSLYQLHLSSFNLESLDRSETIGSIGSRTFYLRKSNATSEISCADEEVISTHLQPCPFMVLFPSYISRGIAVILRRMCRLWCTIFS